ncbi:15687_t:CDS:2 [Funneliformis geosporum]|uniref:15687_t:CDS:1 n=1 Tax=Funneliformis geosporum TaxID=1117311 RepID=A0A9W4WTR2_9GLOM|nr:15687_t:CDS:2 [Funneliformis geosporum]
MLIQNPVYFKIPADYQITSLTEPTVPEYDSTGQLSPVVVRFEPVVVLVTFSVSESRAEVVVSWLETDVYSVLDLLRGEVKGLSRLG